MLTVNQNAEQLARDKIDALLIQSGWLIQNKSTINFGAAKDIANREYQTDRVTTNENFQGWIFKKQAGTTKYRTGTWLRLIKDYIANSFHVDKDDFKLDPFNKQGGLGKMWQLFGEETDAIINLNERLIA